MGKLSHEVALAVIEECHTNSLTNSLKKHGVNTSTFFNLLAREPSLEEAYGRAQQSRSEVFMDEIINIADSEDDPQRARNRIEVRRLYASKMKPGKFGDRIDINLNQTVDIRGALAAARERLRPVSEIEKSQTLEITSAIHSSATGLKPDAESSPAKEEPNLELDDLLK